MKSIHKLKQEKERLEAKVARSSGQPRSSIDAVAGAFHLGMVGGSGPNTASLNRKREASLDRTIDNAVAHVKAVKDLAWVNAQIRGVEDRPRDLEIKERVAAIINKRGSDLAATLKKGDMVRWVVSGTDCKVIRVNRTSVTVEMCGGEERLKFNEIESAA